MRPTGRSPQSEGIGRAIEYLTTHPAEAEKWVRAAASPSKLTTTGQRERVSFGFVSEVCGAAVASANVKVEQLEILVLTQYYAPEVGATKCALSAFCRNSCAPGTKRRL